MLTFLRPAEIRNSRAKTTGSHVALRRNFSGPVIATDPVKVSKDTASVLICTRKIFFGCGVWIFKGDVIRGRLSGHLGPLYLALGAKR